MPDGLSNLFRRIESAPDYAGHTIDSFNYRNGYLDTPLHIVSYWGDCEAIILLLDNGADINAKGETGYSPLHCAVDQNHYHAVKLLLQLGAAIQNDDDGYTPLDLAEMLEHHEIAAVLKV
jgi:uncharacterized protein